MKSNQLQIRVNDIEKESIKKFADEMHMSVSELVLECVRAAYVHRPELIREAEENGARTAFYKLASFNM